MGFRFGEVVKLPDRYEKPYECPTTKTPYATKREAQRALKQINANQRHSMRSFRCGYCERYHLGHRRGEIF
jgi:aspartate carbamoyltransferase regulatory subunit